jgi:hypothetical protein
MRRREQLDVVAQGTCKELVFTVGRREQPDVVAHGTYV